MNLTKVLGLRRNKEISMNELFEAYYKKAYNKALRKTNTVEDAEDLCMETFERACRFFHTYDPSMNFETWLNKIMDNVSIDNYKKSFKGINPNMTMISLDKPVETDEGTMDLEIPDNQDNPEKVVMNNFDKANVRQAINALDEDHRQVIILADIENKKYEEIAQIVNIPLGTVRSRIFRARQELKNMLLN